MVRTHLLQASSPSAPERRRDPRGTALALLAIGLAFVVGCGSGRPPRVPVTGVVVYRGKPLDSANVTFMPKGGRPASGLTDAQGRFLLRTFDADDGALEGGHVVCISKNVPDPNDKKMSPLPQFISILPSRYSMPMESPLKATVTAKGPNDFRFEVTD